MEDAIKWPAPLGWGYQKVHPNVPYLACVMKKTDSTMEQVVDKGVLSKSGDDNAPVDTLNHPFGLTKPAELQSSVATVELHESSPYPPARGRKREGIEERVMAIIPTASLLLQDRIDSPEELTASRGIDDRSAMELVVDRGAEDGTFKEQVKDRWAVWAQNIGSSEVSSKELLPGRVKQFQ